jgi:O-antigen/teichoic acid export membrane protein
VAEAAARSRPGAAHLAVQHLVVAAASRALGLVGVAAYLRLLSPEDYAIYALALVNEQVLFILTGYALTVSLAKHLSDAERTGEPQDEVIGTTVVGLAVVGVVGGLLWQAVAAPVARLTMADTSEAILICRLLGVSVAAGLLLNAATSVWIVRAQVVPFGLVTLFQYGAATAIGIALILLGLGPVGAMIGWTASTCLAAAGGLAWLRRRGAPFRFSRPMMRRMLAYGSPLIVGELLMIGVQTVDRYVVRVGAGLQDAAVYTTAVLVAAGLGATVVTAFKRMWTAVMWRNRGRPGEHALHAEALLLYVCAQLALLAVLGVYGDIPMRLLSGGAEEFAAAGPAIALVYSGFVIFGTWDILSAGYFFEGTTRLYSWSVAATLVVETAVAIALVSPLGLWGPALANPVAWIVFGFMSWRFGRRFFAVEHAWGRVALVTVATTLAATAGWFLRDGDGFAGEVGGAACVLFAIGVALLASGARPGHGLLAGMGAIRAPRSGWR